MFWGKILNIQIQQWLRSLTAAPKVKANASNTFKTRIGLQNLWNADAIRSLVVFQ